MVSTKPRTPFDPFRQVRHLYHTAISPHREIFSRHTPKVRLSIERPHYRVKIAETVDELNAVLRLRYEVFHREMAQKLIPVGIDIDRYDWLADHLIVVDRRTDRVVGTYRLIGSPFSRHYYSEMEFEIGGFLEIPGVKIELSRACVHKDHRTGSVMHLLWRGVSKYMAELGARYLFGCASVWTISPVTTKTVQSFLKAEGSVLESPLVAPLPSYRFESLPLARPYESESSPAEIPPLFKSYLRMGAKVAPEPAIDRDFRCVDFFTVLDRGLLASQYDRKYGDSANSV